MDNSQSNPNQPQTNSTPPPQPQAVPQTPPLTPQPTNNPPSPQTGVGNQPGQPGLSPQPTQPPPPTQPNPPTPNQPSSPPKPPQPPSSPPQENPTSQPQQAAPAQFKKSSKKTLIIIILVIVFLVGLGLAAYAFISNGGLGGSESANSESTIPSNKQITLEYWGLWEPTEVVDEVISEFESQNPNITVNYTQESPQDYKDRLQSSFARGDGPDIFRFHNTWKPMLINNLDLLPESIMDYAEYQNTFYPVIVEDLRQEGQFVGIPLMIDGLGLYYNKSIFATAGQSPPTTWEDLRNTATKLTIKNGDSIQRGGIALGTTNNVDHFSDILGVMFFQNGANPGNPTNQLAEHSLIFYTIFSETDKVWDNTLPSSTYAFATEKSAMMIAPSWRAHEVVDINPSLDFAVIPIPQLPNNEVTWATYWVEGVWSQSPNKQAAWQLLKFMSSKESLRKMYTKASEVRRFGEPFPRIDMADQLSSDPVVGAYIQQAPTARSWPMSSGTMDNGINDQIIKYYEDAINAYNGGTSASQALEQAAQGVIQVLSKYGVSAQ